MGSFRVASVLMCGSNSLILMTMTLRMGVFFFSSRRRHTRSDRDWSSDVCSSDLHGGRVDQRRDGSRALHGVGEPDIQRDLGRFTGAAEEQEEGDRRGRRPPGQESGGRDRKSTRLNSSHDQISYAVFCLKKKKKRYATANMLRITASSRIAQCTPKTSS